MFRAVLSRTRAPVTGVPEPTLPRLRAAVAALFALDGFVFGSWAARVPDVSVATGAGHTALGVALLCLSLGALACMQLTAALPPLASPFFSLPPGALPGMHPTAPLGAGWAPGLPPTRAGAAASACAV